MINQVKTNIAFDGKLQVTKSVEELSGFQQARKQLTPILDKYDVFIKTVMDENVKKYFVEITEPLSQVKATCKNKDLSSEGLMSAVNKGIEIVNNKMELLKAQKHIDQTLQGIFDAMGSLFGKNRLN